LPVARSEDREGNLWLGTGGFGALRKARQGFVTFRLEGSTDILETLAGELCAGRRAESLLKDGRFTEIRPKFSGAITWLGWGTRQTILQDRSGDWWFPAGQGLFRFGPSASVKSLAGLAPKAIYTQRDGLASGEVFRLFEDGEGNIWVASIGRHNGVSRQSKNLPPDAIASGIALDQPCSPFIDQAEIARDAASKVDARPQMSITSL
jgi:hypothetical protein